MRIPYMLRVSIICAIIIALFIFVMSHITACTYQTSTLPDPEERIARNEIHVGILSAAGETTFGNAPFTYHLSCDYKTNDDSANIVNQLIHVNQVVNHGAAKDLQDYPYTSYGIPSAHGNTITENPVSVAALEDDTIGVANWLMRICDNGYAPHTLDTVNTHYLSKKIIYPNL